MLYSWIFLLFVFYQYQPIMSFETTWTISTRGNEYHSQHIGKESDRTSNGSFYFIVGADSQFGMIDYYNNANYDPYKTSWAEDMRRANLAVEKVNQLRPKPRFFVICGDLTNEFPTSVMSVKEKQIKDFKTVFGAVDPEIPLICVCGNHDVGDSPTVETVSKYRADYGDDYFTYWVNGVLFIVLNSQYFKDPTHVKELAAEQEQWLDRQLSAGAGHPIICISHIPWFNDTLDEPEGTFNIPYDTRIRLLEKLYNAGVRHCFFGHMHRNKNLSYKAMEMTVTSAIGLPIGSDKPGLRLVKVNKDKVSHVYYPLEDMPTTVSLE